MAVSEDLVGAIAPRPNSERHLGEGGLVAGPGRSSSIRARWTERAGWISRGASGVCSIGKSRRSRLLWSAVTVLALAFSLPHGTLAQEGTVTGTVRDTQTGQPVRAARVELMSGGRTLTSGTSGLDGQFRVTGVSPGTYSVLFLAVGYEPRRVDGIVAGPSGVAMGPVDLVSRIFSLNTMVVTVSRMAEAALDAPASVHIVDTREIEDRPATTSIDHVRGQPGVDVVTSGVARHSVSTRGFNGAASARMFVLTDHRWAAVPSLRFNLFNLIPTADEDVERIEIVLGPGSALYGPNVSDGVMHIITRSPFEHQGTTVSLMGGERNLFQGSVRHAGVVSDKIGYKVSGTYFRADEWLYADSVELANRAAALAAGALGDTLRIGQRDFGAERFSGDARLDFKPDDQSTLVLSGGLARLVNSLEQSSAGTAQAVDWTYTYAQARFRRNRLFAQTYVNWSDAGRSYQLRNGAPITDNSLLYVGQIQHGVALGGRQQLTYGVDLIRTIPRTEGTINGRNENDDAITEYGAYLQSETALSERVDVVAAARLDYHSVLDALVFSPRAGVMIEPADGHHVRLTYNRAFTQPATTDLFLDILSSPTLGGLPFGIRANGVPPSGYSFSRDCGGLCMRSPFTPAASGGAGQLLQLDATLFWNALVQIIGAQDPQTGALLGLMAPPSSANVGTEMRMLNTETGQFDLVGDVADVPPLKPSITNTLEAGYKGLIADRLLLGVDVYYSRIQDLISGLLVSTPNVFLEPASLSAYLASEATRLGLPLTAAETGAIAQGLASIPVATVTPENVPDPSRPTDIVLTARNFGELKYWGADVGVTVLATDAMSFAATYSFVSEDLFENVGGMENQPLNAPRNKASLAARYRDERVGLRAELRGRYVEGFPFRSGVFAGSVDTYTLVDANVSYALPFSRSTEITVSGLNILDNRHQEVPGAPSIGRIVLLRLRHSL